MIKRKRRKVIEKEIFVYILWQFANVFSFLLTPKVTDICLGLFYFTTVKVNYSFSVFFDDFHIVGCHYYCFFFFFYLLKKLHQVF